MLVLPILFILIYGSIDQHYSLKDEKVREREAMRQEILKELSNEQESTERTSAE